MASAGALGPSPQESAKLMPASAQSDADRRAQSLARRLFGCFACCFQQEDSSVYLEPVKEPEGFPPSTPKRRVSAAGMEHSPSSERTPYQWVLTNRSGTMRAEEDDCKEVSIGDFDEEDLQGSGTMVSHGDDEGDAVADLVGEGFQRKRGESLDTLRHRLDLLGPKYDRAHAKKNQAKEELRKKSIVHSSKSLEIEHLEDPKHRAMVGFHTVTTAIEMLWDPILQREKIAPAAMDNVFRKALSVSDAHRHHFLNRWINPKELVKNSKQLVLQQLSTELNQWKKSISSETLVDHSDSEESDSDEYSHLSELKNAIEALEKIANEKRLLLLAAIYYKKVKEPAMLNVKVLKEMVFYGIFVLREGQEFRYSLFNPFGIDEQGEGGKALLQRHRHRVGLINHLTNLCPPCEKSEEKYTIFPVTLARPRRSSLPSVE